MNEINKELQNLLNIKFNPTKETPNQFLNRKYLPLLQFASKYLLNEEQNEIIIETLKSDIKLIFKDTSPETLNFESEKFKDAVSKYLTNSETRNNIKEKLEDQMEEENIVPN